MLTAMTNALMGVYGAADPARALRSAGTAPALVEGPLALGGAPLYTDATGTVTVAGEVWLDNPAETCAAAGGAGVPGEHGALLAAAVQRLGTRAAAARASGMIAAVVVDRGRGTVTLIRDSVGARTLYTARQGEVWWFAARLRALRRTPAVSATLSLTALRNYLTCAFVPGEETMWRDARELGPGTAMSLPDGAFCRTWEHEERVTEPGASLERHAARLRPVLEQAVRARLPARGAAVTVLLSGGLDSSLVTALAVRQHDGPVHTIAIHFGAQYPNELAYSSLVAAHCGTRHHVLELPARTIMAHLPETLAALDDPIGDPLTVPNLLLGRAAARESEVILNGEGGDPCFGGPKNLPMLLHELYGAGPTRAAAYFRSFQKCYDDLPALLTPEVQAALQQEEPQEAALAPYLGEEAPMASYLNRLMHANVRLKGADHILTKVNNLTSACGLAGRSPLFDQRVVEASFTIPPEHKLAGTNEKAVLKAAVADLLPEVILTRPKSGMLVPVQRWFRDELRKDARRLLLDRHARIRAYINPTPVREWLDGGGGPWPRQGVKLWLLLTLEMWLRQS